MEDMKVFNFEEQAVQDRIEWSPETRGERFGSVAYMADLYLSYLNYWPSCCAR